LIPTHPAATHTTNQRIIPKTTCYIAFSTGSLALCGRHGSHSLLLCSDVKASVDFRSHRSCWASCLWAVVDPPRYCRHCYSYHLWAARLSRFISFALTGCFRWTLWKDGCCCCCRWKRALFGVVVGHVSKRKELGSLDGCESERVGKYRAACLEWAVLSLLLQRYSLPPSEDRSCVAPHHT